MFILVCIYWLISESNFATKHWSPDLKHTFNSRHSMSSHIPYRHDKARAKRKQEALKKMSTVVRKYSKTGRTQLTVCPRHSSRNATERNLWILAQSFQTGLQCAWCLIAWSPSLEPVVVSAAVGAIFLLCRPTISKFYRLCFFCAGS